MPLEEALHLLGAHGLRDPTVSIREPTTPAEVRARAALLPVGADSAALLEAVVFSEAGEVLAPDEQQACRLALAARLLVRKAITPAPTGRVTDSGWSLQRLFPAVTCVQPSWAFTIGIPVSITKRSNSSSFPGWTRARKTRTTITSLLGSMLSPRCSYRSARA
jgi:hypothetical protein